MIAPIINYGIAGSIWYQGESNAGQPVNYRTLFPAMINCWRSVWTATNPDEKDFPFAWVQLANFQARLSEPTQDDGGWPGLREAQSMTLALPKTAQAVIIDVGQANDIHPKDKMDVGHRLALGMLHVAYGKDIVYSGPTFQSLTIEGNKARVKFGNVGSGLLIAAAPSTQPGVPQAAAPTEVKGFSIAGEDKKFHWARARIEGDTVSVWSDAVPNPVAVRYAWANNPECNLYNKEGIPASPFRTDKWVGTAVAPKK
jgi:sialate O-acetylesterase